MEALNIINTILALVFFVCYSYQFFYIPIPWLFKVKTPLEEKPNSFAVLICARNEESVIGDLIQSIRRQTYDQKLLTVFVAADNCTDHTAQIARENGAVVFERFNKKEVGKGYALNMLLSCIRENYPDGFDGYFVFDADNLLRKDYIEQMNKVFCNGYDIVTSLRNSKNYGSNWISAGYALWFLRESRYLNNARMLLHTSCAVSGTGFMFSRKVLSEQDCWPFHLLTEDIEFSVHQISKGYKIGMAPKAELYDEQPISFRQSWRQRLRWSRGYLQVFGKYGLKLISGIFRGSFSCYDMSMTIMPAIVLTFLSVIVNITIAVIGALNGESLLIAAASIGKLLAAMYLTVFFVGAITTITEWKRIHTSPVKKVLYMFTFPLFMFTYIPISIEALFKNKVGWKPITHTITAEAVSSEILHS